MPDLSSVLNENFPFAGLNAWEGVEETFRRGGPPHCWAVKAPAEWHAGILFAMSKLYLGKEGWSSGDGKSGKNGERTPYHPDMIVAGEFDKAANIEACRSMIKELALKPVMAGRRLGVLLCADKLLINAANSLLKIAEEPPSHACLLFLMEGDGFLPTLKSRSRTTVLAAPLSYAASPMPEGPEQWSGLLSADLKESDDQAALLGSWTSHFLQTGEVDMAAKTDRLRLLVQQKKLSQTMVCDFLILTLKEELPFEPILGGFW